jgi:hypothetical protein
MKDICAKIFDSSLIYFSNLKSGDKNQLHTLQNFPKFLILILLNILVNNFIVY